jgi:hypothetical protein
MKGRRYRATVAVSAGVWCTVSMVSCTDPRPSTWADFFEAHAPVSISEEGVLALTTLSNAEQGRRAPSSWGQVPLSALRSGQLATVVAGSGGSGGFVTTTVSGRQLAASIVPLPHHIEETPYWISVAGQLGATGGGRAFVATNLVYPIFVHDVMGRLRDSVGSPPPSWQQARRPTLGEFPPGRDRKWLEYLRSFTIIAGLAVVSDTVLVVSHGRFGGEPGDPFRVGTTSVDIYVGERRVVVDLASPGDLVAYSRTSLFFLSRSEEIGGARLSEYVWRPW